MINRLRLFLASFLTLFLELSLIRFVPAYVQSAGYFANIILLGALLGIGIGILLSRKKLAFFFVFPWLLTILVLTVILFRFSIDIVSPDTLFFSGFDMMHIPVPPVILLPILFCLTTGTFIPLSYEFGKLFRLFPPLVAYSIDIVGALTAIGTFSLMSWASWPPSIWFLFVGAGAVLLTGIPKSVRGGLSLLPLLFLPIIPLTVNETTIWSPYSKLAVVENTTLQSKPVYVISSNSISHQFIADYSMREDFYYLPYSVVVDPSLYKQILIIGAGTGVDAATALKLAPNVEHIDAVEIDPKIAELGQNLNPNQPYDDPRVSLIIDDGRSFLTNTSKHYDLIIFALTDSVVITSRTSNIRLESFLFTTEAFRLAKEHLSNKGVFVLYNYYRERWLIDKIAIMIDNVFGRLPFVKTYGGTGKAATFMIGAYRGRINLANSSRYKPEQIVPAATDDWPFIYVKDRTIPGLYTSVLAIIFTISVIAIFFVVKGGKNLSHSMRYFFLGVGFMLLETKHLITFGLLFGNTWVVNALVFTAILVSVLIAIVISRKFVIRPAWVLYVSLFTILAATMIVPISAFLHMPLTIRYIAASVFYFSPIVLANLIFSQTFKDESDTPLALGVNMLGTLTGGILEYGAMITGYRMLTVAVIITYALALIPWKKK